MNISRKKPPYPITPELRQYLRDYDRDTVLQLVQAGKAPGEAWQTLPAGRFFEELLAELTELYYAHPLAQEEIGYVGLADLPSWTKIGLNEKEDREVTMGE